jgi:hypothetical protein
LEKEEENDSATITKSFGEGNSGEGNSGTSRSSGSSGGDEEEGFVSTAGEHEKEKETEEEMEARIEQERILHTAIKQRKILRLVSQYPVQLSTPFVDEFYQRITNEDSPYDIFDSGLIIVYRLWANTGSHQMFLIRGIREFIKSRQRLGPLWTVDTLETFLVCTLYTEYDLIQSDLMIEPADYEDIEKRMMERLHKELTSLTPPPPPSFPESPESPSTKTSTTDNGIGVSESQRFPGMPGTSGNHEETAVMTPEYEYGMPSEVYYMQKREELEIHRLARYYQQKTTILENLYREPSEFERVSNPFYQRLKEIQSKNTRDLALDKLSPYHQKGRQSYDPYRSPSLLRTKEGKLSSSLGSSGKENDPHRIRQEQDLLQNVLESLATATETTRDNWSEYMECTRKILIEVRDIVRQVRGNHEEAEAMAESGTLISPTHPEVPKSPKSSVIDDVEAGGVEIPEKHEDMGNLGKGTGKGEHSVRMDVLNAKIVWGHGVPIVDEYGLPIGPYSPDKPHLPLPTLERIEFLLDAAGDCLIRSLGLDMPMED